jgi:hypothetical protein
VPGLRVQAEELHSAESERVVGAGETGRRVRS